VASQHKAAVVGGGRFDVRTVGGRYAAVQRPRSTRQSTALALHLRAVRQPTACARKNAAITHGRLPGDAASPIQPAGDKPLMVISHVASRMKE
jgi:hypothetical protein